MKSMVSVWTTLNNLRKIFYDTKHCAVSLRQLSFLLCYVLIISPSPVMWGLAYCKCYIKRYILLILISATCFESSLSFSFGWQASVSCLVAQLLVVCFVVNRDGFEDSMFETKTKASSLRGQGQGQSQWSWLLKKWHYLSKSNNVNWQQNVYQSISCPQNWASVFTTLHKSTTNWAH